MVRRDVPRHPPAAGGPWRFEIRVPRAAPSGLKLPIFLRVTNVSDRPHELPLLGRTIVFDVVISRSGEVVWRRLGDSVQLGILQLRTLGAGEVLTLAAVWDQRGNDGTQVAEGVYMVRGELPTDAPVPMRTAEARLRIGPPAKSW